MQESDSEKDLTYDEYDLSEECDMLVTCKTCSTEFKSLEKFILHKKSKCQVELYGPCVVLVCIGNNLSVINYLTNSIIRLISCSILIASDCQSFNIWFMHKNFRCHLSMLLTWVMLRQMPVHV